VSALDMPPEMRFAMFSLVSIVPGISMLLCAIPMFFYKLTNKNKEKIIAELAEQRKERGIVVAD
jgi:Na+/melibiose symporter-like transporter